MGRDLTLTKRQTALFADLLSQSAIDLPRDEEDPTGRFSRALYPTHPTRAQAIEIVTDTPGEHDHLPGGDHTG